MDRREFLKAILPLSVVRTLLPIDTPPKKELTSKGILIIHKGDKQYCVPLIELEENERT